MSRTAATTDTVAVVALNHPSSGGLITNAQQKINDNSTNIASNDVEILDLQNNKENKSEKNAVNGYAGLDGSGLIDPLQIPAEFMSLKGNWDASTNTPTLIDGTGNTGDTYVVNGAGTVDLGSGNITFAIGDWVMYSDGGVWFKSTNSQSVNSVAGKQGVVTLEIDDLTDVDNSSVAPTDGQVLTWVNANSAYEPKDATGGGSGINVVTKTATATILTTETLVLGNNSSDITFTLPTAVGNKDLVLKFIKISTSNDEITVTDGTLTEILYLNTESIEVVSNNVIWIVKDRTISPINVQAELNTDKAQTTTSDLLLDAELVDNTGSHNTATGVTTVPAPGFYPLYASAIMDTVDASTNTRIEIQVNGTAVCAGFGAQLSGTSTSQYAETARAVQLDKGDLVKVVTIGDANYNVSSSGKRSGFSLYRLSL